MAASAERPLTAFLSTGVWGVMKQASQSGVAQILTRMNYAATLSHTRIKRRLQGQAARSA